MRVKARAPPRPSLKVGSGRLHPQLSRSCSSPHGQARKTDPARRLLIATRGGVTYVQPVLWSERKRMRAIEEREAAGESLWTQEIPRPALVKIGQMWSAMTQASYGLDSRVRDDMAFMFARNGTRLFAETPERFENLTDTDDILNHVEALQAALVKHGLRREVFEELVNRAFNEHRVAFRMVEGEIVPFSSDDRPGTQGTGGSRSDSCPAPPLFQRWPLGARKYL